MKKFCRKCNKNKLIKYFYLRSNGKPVTPCKKCINIKDNERIRPKYKYTFKNLPNEIWKPIKNYEGYYSISNMGRVKTINHKSRNGQQVRKILKRLCLLPSGYVCVKLSKDMKKQTLSLHRLVAIHFITNPKNKPCVNHKKGKKKDNRASQLEWVTYSENMQHAVKLGLWKSPCAMTGKTGYLHPNSKAINQYTLEGEFIKTYGSIREAMRITGITTITEHLIGKCKRAGNYIFKYKKVKIKK